MKWLVWTYIVIFAFVIIQNVNKVIAAKELSYKIAFTIDIILNAGAIVLFMLLL